MIVFVYAHDVIESARHGGKSADIMDEEPRTLDFAVVHDLLFNLWEWCASCPRE